MELSAKKVTTFGLSFYHADVQLLSLQFNAILGVSYKVQGAKNVVQEALESRRLRLSNSKTFH